MKKHLLFLFTALTLLLVPAALKADIVTIGDENSTSSHWGVPVNMFYGYSLTQQIYTADEINMPNGGTITSISFEYTSAASFDMSGVQVYMMNVSKDYFASNTDIVEVGPEYKVYEGTLYASGAGWVTLNLTSHFHYDGTSNLLVCFYDPTSGFMGDTYQFRTTSTIDSHPDQYLTLGWHHDNICPDLDNLSSFSGYKERRYFRANIRLNINPDITEIYVNDFSEPVWGEHPDYSWSVPAGSHYFIYDESRWHDITSSGANIFPTYTFNEEGHDYDMLFFFSCVYGYHFADYVTVYINGSTELVLTKSHYSSYYIAMTKPFHVTQGNTVLIGDENTTLTNTVSPFNSLYGYSFVEQIYTADEIGTPTGSEISCIRFNMQSATEQTDLITIYMKNVSRSAFSSTTDYETVTDDDIVYQGDYTFTQGWNTIMLSTPFHYNGTDNLMIALHENTPGYESLYFYYTNKTNSVVSFHNDDSDPNPYNLASWTANQYVSNRRANIEIDVHPSATVNDGPASSEYVPVYGYWADAYLKAEFVLPAASLTSIPGNSDITSMTFYATQSNVTWENTHFKVFLKEVASTTLSAYNGYADATTVYEGDLSIVKGRMTVQFTTPFTYHGGNLLVGVYNTVNNGSYNTSTWIGVTAEGASISGYNKDSWDNIPAYQRNFLPKTTFTFTTKPEPFVQIGGGTTNNKLLPTYILYSYSLSEQIYTAAEIGQSGNIYSLAFYNTEDASTRDIDIYLAHTSKSDLSDDTDWGTVTAADIVFSGDVSFLEKEWTTITFTAPFAYNGTDNLLIVVDDNTGDWTGSRDFRVFEATGQALHVHNDYTDFNPSNPGSYTGEVFNVKNQIVLNFGPVSCPSPALLTFSNIGKTSATLNWTENGTASEWQICVNGNMGSLITATSKPYTLNSLTPGTSYTVKVRAVCGNSEVSPWIEETFTTLPLCAVPTDLMVSNITENSADLSWTENGEATEWQICLDGDEENLITVTSNPYTLTGLTTGTSYTVKVRANCGDSDGVSNWSAEELFTTTAPPAILSTANWYAYAVYSSEYDWDTHCINFSMQDPTTVTVANSGNIPIIRAAAYTDGYMWYITNDHDLGKAVVDNYNHTISNFETIVPDFESNLASSMSYNPIDGNMYYITTYSMLKRFDPTQPDMPTEIGLLSNDLEAFAINSTGEAYGVENPSGDLYYLDLTDASTTLVGSTGVDCYQMQDMAFDTETGELFWAQKGSANALYWVNPATAETYSLGHLGGSNNSAFTGLFMVSNTMPPCSAPTDLTVSNITPNGADLDWTGSGNGYTVKYRPLSVVFSDDFESGLGQWTQIDADGDGFVWGLGSDLMGTGFASHGGLDLVSSQSYDAVSGALTPDNYLITPQVTLGGMVGFWAKPQDLSYPAEHFGIAVSTTGNTDASDFTTIAEWTLDANDWQQFTVDLSAYAGQTGYVALRHFGCSDNFYLDIDDFTIYGPAPWQTTTTTAANTQLTGLTPETDYLVMVQRDCGSGGTSEWISSIFTTLEACPAPFSLAASNITSNSADIAWTGFGESYTVKYKPIPIVFSDNFESGLGQWTTIDNDGDGFVWGLGSDLIGSGFASHGGSDIVCSQSYDNGSGALTPDNYLITPQVTLGGTVVFWANPQDPSYPAEHFGIAVSTTGNTDASDFTTIAEWTLDANDWQQFTVDLSAYAGQTGYVALRHFGCTDQYYLNIDDFTIYGPEPWQTATTTTNNTQFTGLTPETGYIVQVQSDCGSDGMSDWSENFIFTTLENTIVSDFIDFETNDFSQHPFNQDATYPWIIADVAAGCDNGSNYCMMSGNAGVHSSTSAIEATHTFPQDGYIAFDAKCMGEGEDYDVCEFYIDGDLKFYYGDDLGGWNHFVYNITAGTHTFKWSYTKDNNVNPEGDAFFVDNIKFGTGEPCTAPWSIAASAVPNGTATVTWQGDNSSFTLQYTLEGSGTWNAIEDITGLSYTISGLAAGNYVVRVAATCDPSNWISTTFSVIEVNSTANWYAYATYSLDNESWRHKFISFSMQDPATLYMATDVVESSGNRLYTYAATYADGYVWAITEDGDLVKATLDNNTKTISNFVTVVPYFDINDSYSLSYNPVDGRLYYFDKNKHLKSFFTADPSNVTTVGTFSLTPKAFAINNAGVGYLIENSTGYLYQVNLSDASTSLVGSTGHESSYTESLGFDTETGELFWAMFASETEIGLYKVNPNTAESHFVGQVGGGSGAEISVLFMVGNITPPCPAPTSLAVSNITENSAELSWTESGTATEWQICVNGNEGSPIDVTENPYTLTGLTPNTNYTVKVRSYCGDAVSDWSTEESFTTITDQQVNSTADWYAYAWHSSDPGSWEEQFISFSMQNPSVATAATSSPTPEIFAAAYADGYVWYFTYPYGDLGKAVVDNESHTISNFETITSSYESNTAVAMSYNPIDGRMYYLDGYSMLKSFDPAQPSDVATIGQTSIVVNNLEESIIIYTLAINSAGEAYGVEYNTDNLYHINLTDASISLVGHTGHSYEYSQGMAFDLATGELFWAQYNNLSDNALYLVNSSTAETYHLGRLGGGHGGAFTCMFMVGNAMPPCPAPTNLLVSNITSNSAELSWTNLGSAIEWQISVNGDEDNLITVTNNSYEFTGLTPETSYIVKVRANCGSDGVSAWSSVVNFNTLPVIHSTANWYAYALSSSDGESWEGHYINFPLQNPSTVTAATSNTIPITFAAAYANGYMWYIDYSDGHLGKAVVDNANHTISNFETIVSGFESDETTTMSYNPIDGKMYYIDINSKLKSFDPAQPNVFTEVGTLSQAIVSLAINNEGEAYGVEFQTGNLYHVDLTNASTILVGSTGHDYDYPLDLAFDMETGELFWAQYSSALDNALYWVNPGTAQAYNIGRIGGGNGGMFAGLFMVGNSTPSCTVPTDLEAGNITKHTAELSWTENGTASEWQMMINHDEEHIIDVTGNPYILDNLDAYTEYTVQVRANCGSGTVSDWSDEEHFITLVGCQPSNDLSVESVSYNTATLTWSGEGESFNVEYSLLGSGTWETINDIMPPYTLTGLTPGSNYEVHVIGNCGTDGLSNWSNTVEFTTPTCPIPSGLTANNVTSHTADLSWTENGTASEWQISLTDGSDVQIITTTSVPAYTLTGLNPNMEYAVMVQSNCDGVWSGWSEMTSFITPVGCEASNDLTVTDVIFDAAILTWTGEGETFNVQYRTASGTWVMANNVTSPYALEGLMPNTDYEAQVQNDCGTDGLSDWSNLVNFTTLACPVPTGLAAGNITKHTADLSWTENGFAVEWQILVTSDEVNTLTVSENPYTLTGLNPETEYTVQVRANCGGTWSDWSEVISFITPIGCQATNDLAVTDETYSTATLTWTGEGETFNVQYSLFGSGTWETIANITSPYVLTGLQSSTYYEVQVQNNCGTDGLSDWSNLMTFITPTCPVPSDLEATNITKHTADLSWTENGSATEWQILVTSDEIDTITVTGTSYTLTGLDTETEYTVEVRANCGESWSDWCKGVHFITDIACHATEDLHVTAVTSNSATLGWTGEGETFNMQYRISDGEWTTITNVTSPYTLSGLTANTSYEVQVLNNCGIYGTSGWSNTATFATSLCPAPANLTVTNITKNSAVLSWTETGSATAWELSIDNHYINLLDIAENPYTLTGLSAGTEYTVKVSSVCGASWSDWSNEVTFTTEVACTPTEDLAVTDYTYNTVTLNWTGEGIVFHLRHRIPGGEWVETGGVVPPYTLTGLNPGTTYEAQVQNECSGTQSEWSNLVTFYTSACDPQAIPYVYNFETEEPFYCWSHVAGDVQLLQALPSYNHTPNGQYSLAFNESASDVIAFPQFTQEVNTLQVSFWVRPHNNSNSGNGTFAVGYLTDVNDASTFTAVSTYSYDEWPGTFEFLRKIVTLQDAPDGAIIAFRHDSPTANGSWYVDDIVVSAICDVPTGITVSNITNHSATVTWTDNGAISWDVALNSSTSYPHNVTTNQYTFTSLIPGTENSVMVRSRCGDDILSNWSEPVTFTTPNNSIPTYATITGDSTVCHLSNTQLTANTDVPATYLWSNGATTKIINAGAGTYQVTVTSSTGDTLVSDPFVLTEKETFATQESRSVCPSELPYTWNGHTFPETGMAFVTLTASNGCDSVVTMFLSVNPTYNDTIETTICESELPYIFAGEYLFDSGEYVDTLQSILGCDSVVVLELTINPTYAMKAVEFICSSQLPYEWNGVTFYEEGTEVASFESVNGCDSLVVMTLIVNQSYSDSVEATICEGETYNFYGQSLTTEGEYTHTMQTLDGCDSVEVLTLTVNPTYSLSEERSVCPSALPYEWNGVTFEAAGEQTATLQTVNGCDSVVTMILSVNNAYEVTVTQAVCASELPIVWNGKTFTEAGTQLDTLTASNYCDSIVTMVLTVNTPVNIATTIESCGSYTWTDGDGLTYTESGTHYYEHPDANGCTQVDTLYLTIHAPVNTATTVAVCGSYTWNGGDGVTYTESGTYYYEHPDAHNCTQVDTLYLIIYTPENTAITETACGSYTWTGGTGITYTEGGTYYHVHQDVHGCTQVDTLYLTIYNPVAEVVNVIECGNYTWAANGQTYYVSGEYTYTHPDAHGCTQVDTLRLTILQGSSSVESNIICASELPYEWNGVTFYGPGTQTATIDAANGCDSVITMVLMVNTPVATASSATACESYTWTANGQTYYESGEYTYAHPDVNGCTQVDTLHLTIFTPEHTAITVAECGSYSWTGGTGVTYYESGEYTYAHPDANGCTQVDTLHLTINNPVNTAITVSECGSYTWTNGNGITYYESGEYTYTHTDNHGCTQVDTLYLTINNPVNTAITESECGSYTWNNQTYYVSGEYTYSHQDANGCTQVDTLYLTIHNPVNSAITVSECGSYTWTGGTGITYTQSGEYTYAHTDANGCTQVDTLHLTILQSSSAVLTNTICANELPFVWGGVTFTEAGTQTVTLTAANGCDSVITMVLTVNTPVNTAVTATECGSYTWAANGQTYTTSGVYTYSHQDANGCTQVDTLYLTIHSPVNTAITITECGSYTWNNQTYAASGVYTYSHTDANGCTQVDTLYLTINQQVQVELYETACGSYTWNGQTYTQSNDYSATFTAANGCDSIVVLHLTVYTPANTAITVEECDSYTWTDGDGQTYTISGNYTYSHVDANGCTQVDTLHLTLHYATSSEFTIETADSCYTWNGQTYCASGNYVQTLQTVNGCDSVVTLHLTTSVGVIDHEVEMVFLAPNPTKNICRIMGLETDPVSVDLYDMRGKLVMKASGRELDVTTLPTGLYMVKIYTGDRFINLKLVKQ